MNKILKLYTKVLFLGTLTNIVLIVSFLKTLGFGYKSEISVYIYSIPSYFIKSIIFSLPLFLLLKETILDNKLKRNLILWIPFLLFLFWFGIIIAFRIEFLYPDLSYGYTSRFPHFFIQLLSCLIITISSIFQIRKLLSNSKTNHIENKRQMIGMIKIIISSVLLIIISYNLYFFFKKQEFKSFCEKHSTFSSIEWKENENVRYCMLDSIISEKMLIGKSEDELIVLLGKPLTSNEYYGNRSLQFRTAKKSGQYLHWYLHVELKDGIVINAQKSLD